MNEMRRRDEERGGLIGGAVLIAFGVVFLLRQVLEFAAWESSTWPLFIIGPGLFLFVAIFVGGRGAGRLAVPASVVTTTGLILLCQSIFDRFDTWSYAWALFPTAVGVGTVIAGLWEGSSALVQAGARLALTGAILFLAFGTFFELLLFRGWAIRGAAWPLALIAVGVLLLFRRKPMHETAQDESREEAEARPTETSGQWPW